MQCHSRSVHVMPQIARKQRSEIVAATRRDFRLRRRSSQLRRSRRPDTHKSAIGTGTRPCTAVFELNTACKVACATKQHLLLQGCVSNLNGRLGCAHVLRPVTDSCTSYRYACIMSKRRTACACRSGDASYDADHLQIKCPGPPGNGAPSDAGRTRLGWAAWAVSWWTTHVSTPPCVLRAARSADREAVTGCKTS